MTRDKEKAWTPKEIKALRESLGMTQTEAASAVRVSQTLWSDWEMGRRKPSAQSRLLLTLLEDNQIK